MPPLTVSFDVLRAAGLNPEELASCRISRELWELEDRCQRPDLPASAYADTADVPFVVSPLSPEQVEDLAVQQRAEEERQQALEDRRQAWDHIEQRIEAMARRYAPRHRSCGHKVTVALQRKRNQGGVDNALAKPRCKCLYCHYCRKRRQVEALERARRCLLGKNRESIAAQTQTVYMGRTIWREWKAYDKAIRREWEEAGHRGQKLRTRKLPGGRVLVFPSMPGRMRIRRSDGDDPRDDDEVLVLGEYPWTGAVALPDVEGLALVAEAIEHLANKRHAFRLLGDWTDWRKPTWSCVGKGPGNIDLVEVSRQLAQRGVRVHPFGESEEMDALRWRTDSTEAGLELLRAVCPSFSNAEEPDFARERKSDPAGAPGDNAADEPDPRCDDCPFTGGRAPP
jgi:hypothetical protein